MRNSGYWVPKHKQTRSLRPAGGIALYGWLWKEQFWTLLSLNFIVLLCLLPLITFFPALTAMNRIIYNMIDDRPQMLWPEFKSTFKREWKRSLLVAAPIVAAAVALVLLGRLFQLQTASGWRVMAALFGLISLVVYAAYAFSILGYLDLSVRQTLKNSALMLLICIHYNLIATVILLAIAIVLVLLVPFSVPLILISFVPLFGYTMAYCTHTGVKKYSITPESVLS